MRFFSLFSFSLCAMTGLWPSSTAPARAEDTAAPKDATAPQVAPLSTEKKPPQIALPRIALWNPQMSSGPDANGVDEINIDQDRISRIQNWLRFEKAEATLLRTDEVSDSTKFNVANFDAIFLAGDALPRWMVKPLAEFAQKGGVLVAINARNQPWSLPLVPDVNGRWRAQPNAKKMDELANLFGSHWGDLSDENGAYAHYFDATLWQNLPAPKVEPETGTVAGAETGTETGGEPETAPAVETPDFSQPVLLDFLPAPKVTVEAGTRLYPLIISRKSETDKTQKTPQAFTMQKGSAKSIVVCNTFWSGAFEDGGFEKAPAFWNAIAIICRDWKSGELEVK